MLRRDLKNEVLGGVCAGLGKYFQVDPVIIRLVFVLSVLLYGFGILPYIILWLVVPPEEGQ